MGGPSVTSAHRASRLALALLVTLAIVAAACSSSKKVDASSGSGGSDPAGETPVDGGSMVIGIAAETNGWNPAYAQWADTGSLVGSSVLEPLASMGEDNGAKPWLATSWIANETFTSWAISLREGVQFQDGEPFDAAAVKLNLDTYIKGPLSGLALGPMFDSVNVVDDHTVQVNLTQPWAAFPSSFLQGGSAFMMAPAQINAPDHGVDHPIGTGPFTFDRWTPNSSFKATKNPNYWQPGLPHLDSIEFQVIPDESARSDALQSGDVDMIYTSNAEDANTLDGKYQVLKDWDTEAAFIMTNTWSTLGGKPNPFNNSHARMALAYATDPTAVATAIGEGVEVPTSPWSPHNPWGMPKDQNGWVGFDLDKAKQEVDAYKNDTGASSLDIRLSGLPNVDDQRVLQLLVSQWEDAGINASIESVEQTAYITKIATGDYQAAFFRNYGYPDPDQDYYFWSASTAKGPGQISLNFAEYTNPQMEQDLTTGRQSGYADQRKAAYQDLTKQLNASATNIWLYNTPYSYIASQSVRGLETPSKIAFGNYSPKTWLGELWKASS